MREKMRHWLGNGFWIFFIITLVIVAITVAREGSWLANFSWAAHATYYSIAIAGLCALGWALTFIRLRRFLVPPPDDQWGGTS